jgi:hypothetical protein
MRRLALYIVTGIFAIIALGAVAVGADKASLGTLVGRAAKSSMAEDAVVATVNGETVKLSAVEATRAALQSASTTGDSTSSGYAEALRYQVREIVLSQEARRRGISISNSEAEAFLNRTMAQAKTVPEARRFLEDQREALGLSVSEYHERLLQTTKLGLLNGTLLRVLSNQAPRPTEEQIDSYLDRQPGPNTAILIPIRLDATQSPGEVYKTLVRLQGEQERDRFTTTFDAYARHLQHRGASGVLHQTFRFSRVEELPDYARDAALAPEESVTLTKRSDGSGIISLALKSEFITPEETRETARATLREQMTARYTEAITTKLVNRADIELHVDRLPADAQTLTVESLR